MLFAFARFAVSDDFLRVDVLYLAVLRGEDHTAGVFRRPWFDTCGDEWCLGHEAWCGLLLHVRSHQSSVGGIMVQEWDEGSGDGKCLIGRNVDIVNLGLFCYAGFAVYADFDFIVRDIAVLVIRDGGMGYTEIFLFKGIQILDIFCDLAVLDPS